MEDIRIGDLIKMEVQRQGLSVKDFADKINCKRNNVYDIYKRSHIDITLLKRISKILNRNFFAELAENMDLADEKEESEEEKYNRDAVNKFLDIVPQYLKDTGRLAAIILDKWDEDSDGVHPDFIIPDYVITFTIGNTFKERFGNSKLLIFEEIKNKNGHVIEIITNTIKSTVFINIPIKQFNEDEWGELIELAFKIIEKRGILESWNKIRL